MQLNCCFFLNPTLISSIFATIRILNPNKIIGSVAQLYSALDFGSSGWGLESLRGHKQKPSTKVLGFLVLGTSKIHFDLRIKQKRRNCASSLGF